MKKCPYCAELIKDEAIKCRYCGSELPEEGSANNTVDVEPLMETQRKKPKKASSGITGFIFSLIGIIFSIFPGYFSMALTGMVIGLSQENLTIHEISWVIQFILWLIVSIIILMILNFPMSVGFILSSISLKAIRKDASNGNKGFAITGLILSIITFVVSMFFSIIVIINLVVVD